MIQLAQCITRPSFSVTLSVELFYGGVQFFENFTLCDLNNFDEIIRKTFLDAYKIDIHHNGSKLKIRAKVGFKLINLDVNYNYTLVKVEVNLVVLVNDLK
jgi:hypothetical protein